MKKSIRIFVLLLALLMVLPMAVACGEDTPDTEKTTTQGTETQTDPTESDTTGGVESQPTESESETTPPDDASIEVKDWGGVEFTVVGRENSFKPFDQFEIYREEYDPSDLVGAEIYNRNQLMEEKYGLIVMEKKVSNVASYAATLLAAQDASVGDLLIYIPLSIQAYASMGYFLDMSKMEYIDLEHDCWHHVTTEEVTFGGKLFYNTSKFLLQDKLRTYLLLYNRDRAMELGYSHYSGEDHVRNNTWTLETFGEMKKKATFELDGEDGLSSADAWGVCGDGNNSFAVFCFGAGLKMSTKNADGYPEMVGATEEMITIVDSCKDLILGNDAKSWWTDGTKVIKTSGELDNSCKIMLNGNGLFLCTFPSVFEGGMEGDIPFEYGFLPYPKFDSNQKDFYSTPNYHNGSIFAIPYTANDPELNAYFVQAISEESVDTTYYTFIEEKCKLEDSVDQQCADMLEIIFDSIHYDLAALNDYGGCYKCINSTIPSLPNIAKYAIMYPPLAELAKADLQKIIEAYESFE